MTMPLRCLCRTLVAATILANALLANCVLAQGWKPDKHVELVVPFAPGAGVDNTARVMHKIWSTMRLVETTSTVVNKPGGGGNLGFIYTSQHAGDPHFVTIGSSTMLTNHIIGTSQFSHADFTPLALVLSENIVFSVKADSPLKSGGDLVQRLRGDPQALSFSVGSALGNINHITLAAVAKAAGIDAKRLKVVATGSSGAGMTALLGGHIDVSVSTLGAIVPQVEAGKLRVIGIASPQRLSGSLANVATWKEQGIPVEFILWRVMLGAKGITPEQAAFWEGVFARIDKSEEWQAMAKKVFWDTNFKGSRETRAYMDADYVALKAVLADLGMVKQ